MRRFGLDPVEGRGIRDRLAYLAGADEVRARDLEWALTDPDVDGVWALRGGYGSMRLWNRVDLDAIRRRPRPFLGFSDNTSLHLAARLQRVISFHGPHAGAETFSRMASACVRTVAFTAGPAGVLPAAASGSPRAIRGGRAEGRLVGGNLSLLAAAAGTPFALSARGAILVLEEVEESVYRVDRMLEQLLASGATRGVRGLAIGRFTDVRASGPGRSLDAVLNEFAGRLGVPTLAGLPFGHVADSWTLPLGARARLDADAGTLEVLEAAVR